MRQVTVDAVISAPREEIFDFVVDLAGRPAYCDHFLDDYRLARVNPVGLGAAARFRLKAPLGKQYAELTITEVDRPRRIVEQVAVGRRGRNRSLAVYEFLNEGLASRASSSRPTASPRRSWTGSRRSARPAGSGAVPAPRSSDCGRSSSSRSGNR